MMKLLFVGLLGTAALLGTGCASACEKASDQMERKFKACGVAYTDPNSADTECTDTQGQDTEKLADCIDALDCAEVKSGTGLLACATAP